MAQRLVPCPRAALVLVGVCVAIVLAGAVEFHDDVAPSGLDTDVANWVDGTFGTATLEALLRVTRPSGLAALAVLAAVIALALRRFRLAALAALGPVAAVVLTEVVFKPLVHRRVGNTTIFINGHEAFAYPSGHETGVASVTTMLVLVLVAVTQSRPARLVGVAVALLADVIAAIALVGNHYHYVTDTIGAAALSVATVVGLALAVDQWR